MPEPEIAHTGFIKTAGVGIFRTNVPRIPDTMTLKRSYTLLPGGKQPVDVPRVPSTSIDELLKKEIKVQRSIMKPKDKIGDKQDKRVRFDALLERVVFLKTAKD